MNLTVNADDVDVIGVQKTNGNGRIIFNDLVSG